MRHLLILSSLSVFFFSTTAWGQLGPGELVSEVIPFVSDSWTFLVPQGLAENPELTDPDFRTTWMMPAYDDADWLGPATAPFQYGTVAALLDPDLFPDPVTAIPEPPEGDRYTAYFRHDFTLNAGISQMALQLIIDDGGVFYLDGQPILNAFCCANDPPAFDDLATPANDTELFIYLVDFTSEDLAAFDLSADTTHTLAVEVHQRATDSSDLGLGIRLLRNGPGLVWDVDSGGSWEDFDNWRLLSRPDEVGEFAYFGDVITEPHTIATDIIDSATGDVEPFSLSGIEFNNVNSYALAGFGVITLEALGGASSLTVSLGDHEIQAPITMANDLEVNIAAGSSLELNNDFRMNGFQMTKVGDGELRLNNLVVDDAGGLVLAAGTLSGHGVVGNLRNVARLEPGDGVGRLNVLGDYVQEVIGSLVVQLSADGHDMLSVDGTAYLAGDLHVELVGDFMPDFGDEFIVLQANDIVGEFDVLSLPTLADGLAWDTSQLPQFGRLAVVPEPATCVSCLMGLVLFALRRHQR